jgi:hypothetical protein
MADTSTTGFTVISPEEAAKLYTAKKPSSGYKPISADEAGRLMASKKPAAIPDASKMTQAQAVQQLEGGGLQAPAVDPIDLLTFGAAGGAMGAAKGPAEAGLEALKEAGTVGAAELWNQQTAPIVQKAIPGQGAGAQMARNLTQTAAGFVPFVAAGAGPAAAKGAFQKVGGASEIAEQGIKAGEKASTATESTQSKMADTQAKGSAELDKKYEQFRQQQIPGAKADAQAEVTQKTLGRTPEQTRAAASASPADFAQRQAELRGTILEKKNEVEQEFQKEYEDKFGKYNDKPIALNTTAQKAQQLENWAKTNNIALDRSTQKLLDEAKGLARSPEQKFDPAEYGYTPKKWAQKSPLERQQIMEMASKMEPTGGAAVPKPQATTVAQARGLNSKFGEIAGSQGADGYVARQMRDSILTDLDNSNVPGAKELNNRYRVFRSGAGLGDYDFLGKVSDPKGGDITNMAGEIFKNPQRMNEFTKRLTPEQKGQWREVYGDYVDNGGAVDADQLKALGFQGPLTKPDAWVYLNKSEQKLGDVFQNSPVAQKKFLASLESQRGQLLADNSKETLKIAREMASKLGATGDRIMAKIEAAKTPEEAAKIAYQEFGALNPADEGQAAGVSAIQNASTPQGGLMGRLKHRAEIYSILALSGRPYFMKLALLLGTGTGIHEVLKASVMRSLRDPAAATQLYRAYIEPGAKNSLDTITRNIAVGALPAETAQVGQAITAKPKGPGPMVKQVEHEKAVNIAGPRGAVSPARTSRIEELNKGIAQGKEPEVHADLRNGRLTHTDIAKMVQPDKGGMAGLFQGMSPTQAVDAFAVADPSERELGLSALAQHLQDSAKTTDPKQMAIAMQKLKSIMAQQGATA